MFDYPLVVASISLVVLWLAYAGGIYSKRRAPLKEDLSRDFSVIVTATLTLLSLIIGFSFSMASSRYDLRKKSEAEEANAIGTELVRADLLPASDKARARELLKKYLDQRLLFYTVRNKHQLAEIHAQTARLQSEMWSITQAAAAAHPTLPVALVVSGMNNVLNAEAYTQAAWRNRIPAQAWVLMFVIAMCSGFLIGYSAHHFQTLLSLVLPVVLSIAFFLIADIDSPRGGVIDVLPENLLSLSESLQR